MDYKDYFKGKKITLMRIGLLGRGVGDARFLAEAGAEVLVVDDAPQEVMQPSVDALKDYPNITFKFGPYDLEDFRNCDMVLKGAGTPYDSPEIEEARKNNIPVEMSTSLFVKLAHVKTVGITGTRGKSTTTHLLYRILKAAGVNAHLGGNVKGVSTLAQLPTIQGDELFVLELDSWQLQGFASPVGQRPAGLWPRGESGISPDIAIFTNLLPDHMNYYRGDMDRYLDDKKNVFRFQNEDNLLIVGEGVSKLLHDELKDHKAEYVVSRAEDVPSSWSPKLLGVHNRENIAHAIHAARFLGVSDEIIKREVENFTGVEGRLECVREVDGVSFYNDTTATTPDATRVALHALDTGSKSTVLIMGGADKGIDVNPLLSELPEHCKAVVILPGTGTDSLDLSRISIPHTKVETLHNALNKAREYAEVGDNILLSPAFASFGLFRNEFDRGDQFTDLVKRL